MSSVSNNFSYNYSQAALCEGMKLVIPMELGNSFWGLRITSTEQLKLGRIRDIAKIALNHALSETSSNKQHVEERAEQHAKLKKEGISYTVCAASNENGKSIRFS